LDFAQAKSTASKSQRTTNNKQQTTNNKRNNNIIMQDHTASMSRRTCATYVSDMHALEQHMLEAFERQLSITKDFRDAHAVVLELVSTSKHHAQRLHHLVTALGDVEKKMTDMIKAVVAGIFGVAAGVVDKARPLAASKALRDSYTALNHAIVGYVMLSTTGAALKNEETKILADEFLNDYITLAQKVMAVIPSLAITDIKDAGVQVLDTNAAQEFKSDKHWSNLFERGEGGKKHERHEKRGKGRQQPEPTEILVERVSTFSFDESTAVPAQ
jgi:ferritin-like metal-binding protein YciE